MDRELLLEGLQESLDKCGISLEVRKLDDEEVNIKSGLCEVEGRHVLIVDKRLGIEGRINVILKALKSLNLEGVYIQPALRELIDSVEE